MNLPEKSFININNVSMGDWIKLAILAGGGLLAWQQVNINKESIEGLRSDVLLMVEKIEHEHDRDSRETIGKFDTLRQGQSKAIVDLEVLTTETKSLSVGLAKEISALGKAIEKLDLRLEKYMEKI